MSDNLPSKEVLDPSGIGGDDMNDIMPVYRIEYKTKKDLPADFKKGLWTLAGEEQSEKVEFVLLADRYAGNIRFPDEYDPEVKEPLCRSSDGKAPDGGTEMEKMDCDKCGKSEMAWFEKFNEKPPCQKTQTLLAWDWTRKRPFIMTVRRKARNGAFRSLRSNLKQKVLLGFRGIHPYHCFLVTMGTEDYGVGYLPTFDITKPLSETDARGMQKFAHELIPSFLGVRLEALDKDVVGGPTDKDDDLPF